MGSSVCSPVPDSDSDNENGLSVSFEAEGPDVRPLEPPHQVDDGDWQAWLTVAGGWIISFTTFGSTNSFGVFQAWYTLAGTSSASNISWIGSMQFFLIFSMGLISGKLFDMGYFHYIQSVGMVIYLVSSFMLSLADYNQYYQVFLAQGLGVGLGMGFLFLPALAIQGHYWKKRRSLAIGIVMTGSSIGGIVYPIMVNQLLHHSTLGFAWTVRALSFMDLGFLAIAKLIMFPKPPPKRAETPKPDIRSIVTDVPYLILVTGVFFMLWGLFFPYFYLQLFMTLKGLDSTVAFYSLAVMNAASIPGRTLPNLLVDKYGHFNIIIPVCYCSACLIFAIFGIESTASAIVFAVLYGFFSGAFVSLMPLILFALSKDVSEFGIRMGVGFFIFGFATLAGNPVNGALMKAPIRWYRPIVFSGVNMLVGSTSTMVARQIIARRKGTQVV